MKNTIRPPALLAFLLGQVNTDWNQESLLGDFEETFLWKAQERGRQWANLWYLWHILKLVPAHVFNSIYGSVIMIRNYVKIALRIIKKHKGYSFINILGLGIGMAVCVLILLFVRYELSFDTFHENSDRIYRLERQWLAADGSVRSGFGTLAPGFTPHLEEHFSEMEHIARVLDAGNTRVIYEDKRFIEDRLFFVEDDFFQIFSVAFLRGDPTSALTEPFSLVLTESAARKYFGNADPMGQQLKVRDDSLYQITGIIEDSPSNTHFHYDILASYISLKGVYVRRGDDYFLGTQNFSDNVTYTYMRLAVTSDVAGVQTRIPDFIDRTLGTREDADGNVIRSSQSTTILIRPVTDIHLYSHTSGELEPNFDMKYVRLFTLVALFVLIIACINFMNLSTARATQRAKEVGLRKVVGANRRILTTQFLGESVFFSFLSLLLALAFVVVVLPFFNSFSGRDMNISYLLNPGGILILIGVFLVTGVLAGLYPAVYLSAFKSASILRGELTRGAKGAALRKVLVVFQFAISICLIISVSIVYRQMNYLMNADLGFDRENILMLPADQVIIARWEDIKQNLLASPHILEAALSKRAPTGRLNDAPGFWVEINEEVQRNPFSMPHNRVSHGFFRTFNIQIVAGRDFSREYATDASEAFIINEAAVRRMGLESPQEAVGLRIGTLAPSLKGYVIGVAADFNYESLHNEIRPIITYIRPDQANTASLRIAPGRTQDAIAYTRDIWARFNPESPLQYDFLFDRIAALYRNEARMMQMFGYFSLFAIFISCLGLFGLASFTAARRTKEIGVRKVMGASLSNIIYLLSREFTRWVLVANLISWPVAYIAMNAWLKNFAYKVQPHWPEFVLAGLATFVIALLTVSFQSFKAATCDPVQSIRYE
ncbi:MAG: FtsX-like permease family protein [Candidatus Aminicenantaceae bacterium]